MSGTDYSKMTEMELGKMGNKWLRKHSGKKAHAAGNQNTFIKQNGSNAECVAYLKHDIWAGRWGEPTPIRVKAVHEAADDSNLSLFDAAPLAVDAGDLHQLGTLTADVQDAAPAPDAVSMPPVVTGHIWGELAAADQDLHPEALAMPEVLPVQQTTMSVDAAVADHDAGTVDAGDGVDQGQQDLHVVAAPIVVKSAPPHPHTRKFSISTFVSKGVSKAYQRDMSFEEIVKLLTVRDVRAKKDGKLFAPATFSGSRSDKNFVKASGVCFDFDAGQPTIERVLKMIPGTLAVWYSTHSHGWTSKVKKVDGVPVPADTTYTPNNPRFRVVVPLSRSVNAEEHALLVMGIKSIIPSELMECLDLTCFEKARSHYLPSCLPGHESHAFSGHQDGEPLDVEHFIGLGAAVSPVVVAEFKPVLATAQVGVQHLEPANLGYEYADPKTGEVVNLADWAAQNPGFDIMGAVHPKYRRGGIKDGKQKVVCPFADQHTDQADDFATFAANASPPEYPSWTVHCCHAHCADRDRLEFLYAMLELGWITVDQLGAEGPEPVELKRPSYMNYRAQEIVAELVRQPLDPEEFRVHLHLMHAACAVHDGTLPDDSWTISRILGIPETQWLERFRPTLTRSGWQIAEGGRLYNSITRREYLASQSALMKQTAGGTDGGKKSQENRRKLRDAFNKGT